MYIVEVGQPYSIGIDRLNREIAHISEAQEFVEDYGYPDYSEIQEIAPEWPWESYELRLYYLRPNIEVDFGHVFLSDAMPHFGVSKFQGDISPDKRHEIELVLEARQTPLVSAPAPQVAAVAPAPESAPPAESGGLLSEALVARIEAAAERAAQAADRAAADSEAAVKAADRTVNIIEKMEAGAGR